MGPRGDGDYRAGEAKGLSFGSYGGKKRLTDETASLSSGDECKKRPAGKPGQPFSDGEKEPNEGEAVFAGGEDNNYLHGVEADGYGAKKYRADEPHDGEAAPLLPDGKSKNLRADDPHRDNKKPHNYKGEEATHLFSNAKRKKPCDSEAAPLLPDGECKKCRHLFWNGERKTPHDGEAAPLFLSGEVEDGPRADEPVHLFPERDKYKGEAAPMFHGISGSGSEETSPPPPLADRTPALIAEALQASGPPPRRLIHRRSEDEDEDEKEDPVALALYWRGVEREDRYDPYVDYFFVGRPQAYSWYQIWRERPLQLHDAGLVAAVDSVIMWGAGLRSRYLDVSDHVTRVLEAHPGPVATLRLDASEFPSRQQLNRWMPLLSVKQAKQVILINLTTPIEETEVALDQLCSRGLTYLGVGFLNLQECLGKALVSAGDDGHPWSTLRHLSLTACLFLGPQLEQTVKDLWGLRTLRISNSELTQGCDEDNGLHIESPKLVCVVFSSCTATKKLVLGRAPALTTLQLGVRSAITSSATSPPIHIHFCECLHELHLSLPYHDITLWSSYTTKVNRKAMLSFRSLKTLVTIVNMANSAHSVDDDGQAILSLDSVPGINNSLQHLTVSHFTGGTREMSFIAAILKAARQLLSVAVHVHPNAATPLSLRETAKFLKERPTISKHCRIRVGPCSGCGSP
ncbi:hypothetical protein BDA96_01G508200 [Sorghum bicolor]|uniref:FBD domain-containing protein n=1 Tax=Sorghum bicolor TaxID=4558 RepID=A0A921S5L7_SORBI|nr:hypothetical protein BDA96_01G508200 [Sorghum bicolor]